MKKLLIILFSLLGLLLVALIAIPYLYKDKIVAIIKDEANKNLNAKIDFDNDIDLSLIRNFPNLRVSISKLSVVNVEPFEGDTLLSLNAFTATIDVMSLISGDQMKIKSILLDEPRIHVIVLKDGKANYDIAKPSTPETATTDTGASSFNVALQRYAISNGYVVYEDKSMALYTEITGLNHEGKGDFTQDLFELATETKAETFDLVFDGVKYFHKVNTEIKANLEMDMVHSKYTFKQNEARLNNLFIGVDGWVAMPADDIDMDIKFNAAKTDFKNILSLVPAIYAKDFDNLKSAGKMALDGFVKGVYNDKQMPGFGLNLLVENGMFQYPSLPDAVNNVQVKLNIVNPDGNPDKTVIDLSRFHAELGKEAFDAHLLMKYPVSDPLMDANLKGRIDLGNMSKMVPLEEGMKLEGLLVSDFSAKGRLSAIQKGQYQDFQASGKMEVSKLLYASKDLKQPVNINSAVLTFNPKNVSLNNFDAKIGHTDMHMNGTLDNLFAYVLNDDKLKGNFTLSSQLIDANEFLSDEETKTTAPQPADTVPLEAFEIPANIDFTLSTRIGRLLYDNIELTQLHGVCQVVDQKLVMNDVGMNIFNGSVDMNGFYDSKNIKKPLMDMKFGLHNVDIQKMFTSFETIQQMAPVAANAQGSVSSVFSMNTTLDQHLQPLMNTISAKGWLDIPQVVVKDYKPLVKVAEVLKMPQYKELKVSNVKFNFVVRDGRVMVEPFDLKAGNISMNVFGSSGLDQSLDYKLAAKFPKSELGGAANEVLGSLSSKLKSNGVNLSMSDIINVDILMGGTVPKPEIKTSLKDMTGSAKDAVKEEFNKKKAEAEAKAKAEAEKARQQAEAEAQKLKSETEAKAKAEADRLKQEAEQKKKEAQEAARKKAKEEADKKLKGLFKK